MSDTAIKALLEKRAELTVQLKDLQSAIFHIDATLGVLGHQKDGKPYQQRRLFAPGELIELVGAAERAGAQTNAAITLQVMAARGMDPTDEQLRKRIQWSVKECRKRTAAVVRAAKGG